MAIHVSYFGKQNPKTALKPISSYTWDKPPFGQEPKIDWKTGKIRSALFEEEKKEPPIKSVASSGVVCKITSGKSASGYFVDVYANGPCEPKTGTATLSVVEISGSSDLPIGSWILGFPFTLTITGGNE